MDIKWTQPKAAVRLPLPIRTGDRVCCRTEDETFWVGDIETVIGILGSGEAAELLLDHFDEPVPAQNFFPITFVDTGDKVEFMGDEWTIDEVILDNHVPVLRLKGSQPERSIRFTHPHYCIQNRPDPASVAGSGRAMTYRGWDNPEMRQAYISDLLRVDPGLRPLYLTTEVGRMVLELLDQDPGHNSLFIECLKELAHPCTRARADGVNDAESKHTLKEGQAWDTAASVYEALCALSGRMTAE